MRKRLRKHRSDLQSKQTNAAKKRLRKIARRQSRFVRDTNHCVSKKLVATALALKKALVLEDLSGIRERSTVSKSMRWLLGHWAFDQLKQFLQYKAEAAGLSVLLVDPRHTSRICCECGYLRQGQSKVSSPIQVSAMWLRGERRQKCSAKHRSTGVPVRTPLVLRRLAEMKGQAPNFIYGVSDSCVAELRGGLYVELHVDGQPVEILPSQSLLRPAQAPAAVAEVLLQPAAATADEAVPAEQLLRPSSEKKEETG